MKVGTPHTGQQPAMQSQHQRSGQPTRGERTNAVVEGGHVVDHFGDIPRSFRIMDVRLGPKQVAQRTLRTLDLARQDRFPTYEHEHEEIRVGQNLNGTVKPTEGLICMGQQRLQFSVDVKRRIGWQRFGKEGVEALRLTDVGAGAVRTLAYYCRHMFVCREQGFRS